MRQITSRSVAGFLLLILFCAGCGQNGSGSLLTPANYDQVSIGMSKTQIEKILGPPTKVETILGPPTAMETKDMLIFKKTTYRYEDGKKFALVTFKNDEVDSKDSNLGREP